MSNGIRIVPEDELAYARDRIVAWCSKLWPQMTLAQVQSLAVLLAVERQKAAAVAAAEQPRRERRVCMPITLPAGDEEDDVTEPRGKR